MDYTLVFDVSNEYFKWIWLLPIAIVFFLTFILWNKYRRTGKILNPNNLFTFIILLIAIGTSAFIYKKKVKDYKLLQKILSDQDYKIVEGVIENFDPMPHSGHKKESFLVQDVLFEYSDFDATFYGFNNTRSHGGPIKGNGQNVKINYYTLGSKNIILKLWIEN